VKTFVFGRADNDPKGKPEECGEVRVNAPDIHSARASFVREVDGDGAYYKHDRGAVDTNSKDPRLFIVRVEGVELVERPKKSRSKKS
jgi:hypothetical protein